MSFFEELKKLTKPYDEDEEDYEDEIAEQPVRQRSRSGVFSSFGGETEENRTSKPQQSAIQATIGLVIHRGQCLSLSVYKSALLGCDFLFGIRSQLPRTGTHQTVNAY